MSNIKVPPVFICGYPKSGTTLLLALLDRHPELLVFPEESKFLPDVLRDSKRQNLDYVLTQTGPNVFRFGEITLPSGYRDYSSLDFTKYQSSLQKHWDESDRTPYALLESVVLAYSEVTGQINKKYWVEKTPLNERDLSNALTRWPELRAIYILRDARDNYCSYRKKRVKDSRTLSIEEFVAGWSESVHAWERFAAHNINSLFVRYDDLVESPRVTMQKICEFIGIDWDDILLRPTRNGVFWSGNSMHGTKFKGISAASLGKYRELLTLDDLHLLETYLGSIMERYGWHLGDQRLSFAIIAWRLISYGGVALSLNFGCYVAY